MATPDHFLKLLAIASLASTLSAQVTRVPNLVAKDLYYSGQSGLLYATIGTQSPSVPNTVAILDPTTGSIVGSIPVGPDPGRMAASDDGQYLFVALDGDTSAQRIHLSDGTAEPEFSVKFASDLNDNPGLPRRTVSLKVIRGKNDTVAVAQGDALHPFGVAIYRSGVQLPNVTPPTKSCNNLTLTDTSDTLWCYDNLTTGGGLQKLHVDDDGVKTAGDPLYGLACGCTGELRFHAGLLYQNLGPPHAFDPETHIIRGTYPEVPVGMGGFAVDGNAGVIFFGRRGAYETYFFSFDLTRFTLQGVFVTSEYFSSTNPGMYGAPDVLIVSGPGRLAAIDSQTGQVWIFSLDLLQPVVTAARTVTELGDGIRALSLPSNAIAYDPNSDRIYAAIPNVPSGNALVAVDPVNLSVGPPLWVGSNPLRMGISSDGHYLYQSLYGASYVQRVDLTTFLPDLQIPIFGRNLITNQLLDPDVVMSLGVLPGSGQSVAISGTPLISTLLGGTPSVQTAIYDGAEPRPVSTNGGGVSLQLDSSGTRIFNGSSPLVISADGVRTTGQAWPNNGSFPGLVRCQNDICFASEGDIVDVNAKRMLGRCPYKVGGFGLGDTFGFSYGGVLPDVTNRRVYFVSALDKQIVLNSCNLDTFLPAETLTINGVDGYPVDLLSWRSDQLAFTNLDAIFTIPKSALKPVPATLLPSPAKRGSTLHLDFKTFIFSPVYDPSRKKLYVGLRPSEGSFGNSIATINPVTGIVESTTFVGGEPGLLELSDDGSFLYVQLDWANTVVRLNLATSKVDLRILLPDRPSALRVQPGHPDTIAIAYGQRVALFRNDAGVGKAADLSDRIISLEFSDQGDTLYAVAGTPWGILAQLHADTTGLSVQKMVTPAVLGQSIRRVGGRLIDDGGRIFDAQTLKLMDQVGSIQGAVVDVQNGRIYGNGSNIYGNASGAVQVYGLDTLRRIGWWPGSSGLLIPCGPDLMAIANGGGIDFLTSDTFNWTLPLPAFGLVGPDGLTRLNANASAIAYDRSRRQLIVVTSPDAGPDGNALLRVDPSTGAIVDRLLIGNKPSYIVADRVRSQAYVGLDGPRTLARVDLQSHAIVNVCNIPQVTGKLGEVEDTLVSRGIAALPGGVGSIAVSLRNPSGEGFVAVMDQCAPRRDVAGPYSIYSRIGPLALSPDAKTLYGSPFISWTVTPTGLSGPSSVNYPYLPDLRPFDSAVMCGSVFYTSAGQVYDPT